MPIPTDVRDGVATLHTEKSQGEVEVALPLLPPLLEALTAGPSSDLAFICGSTGRPDDQRELWQRVQERLQHGGRV